MAYLGRYQLGDLVPLALWSRNAAGTPTEPTTVPFAQVLNEAGTTVRNITLPIVDRNRINWLFGFAMNLDARFSTQQQYTIHYTYNLSGTVISPEPDEFEVTPGGSADGAGIAMHFFRQPSSDYVLLQTDNGTLFRLRRPEVRNA